MSWARRRSLAVLGLLVTLAAWPGFGCTDRDPRPRVFVAASMYRAVTEALQEQGVHARVSPAASSTLARQIENGAPAAVFISANTTWMDFLRDRRLMVMTSRRRLVSNRLVLVGTAAALKQPDQGRIAIGDPDAKVPLGLYAKAYLQKAGRWESNKDRLVTAPDAPSTLRLVQLGEAEMGYVYATDAKGSGLQVVALGELGPAVVYESTILRAQDSPATRKIYDALTNETAARIYARYGFEPRN